MNQTLPTSTTSPLSSFVPLLTREDLEALFRLDRRTIARLCQRGQLPRPIKIGGSNRWRLDQIQETLKLLELRSQQRSQPNVTK